MAKKDRMINAGLEALGMAGAANNLLQN